MNPPQKTPPIVTLLLNTLEQLQKIDLLARPGAAARAERERLRTTVPEPILAHYDRLMARGKKGIVSVRNQTCAGCHLRLPMGVIMALKAAENVQLCENCGRYLVLHEEVDTAAPTAKQKRPTTRRRQLRAPGR